MTWGSGGRARRPDKWIDPLARDTLVVAIAAGTKARFGYWPEQFLDLVKRFHHGRIPAFVPALVDKLAREQPWVIAEDDRKGPPTIHVGAYSFAPTVEEWDEAGR